MPIFDYKCECGKEIEVITRHDENAKCPECGKEMKRLLTGKIGISMGVGPYGYYDDTLGAYVSTNAERKRLMKEQGVSESYGKGWM
ncbi:MAG: zinc ribbon domain-containing protein [Desulfobacula sp.]|jgi:putative FmdB family regulatory protein|uniref:FmdB family zinc ribbon protein n=1 Tax=Desulfobacula sp. TaxID=2593537 RepID=UPI0039B9B34A|nr:zinc ribbon domain-containing protein [Desulfobacula sp.]